MTDERIPQPAEWQTLDDVVAWAEAAARADNLYIAEDLERVRDSLERELTELREEVEYQKKMRREQLRLRDKAEAERDVARDLFRAASKFEVKLTDELTAAREVVEAARNAPCLSPRMVESNNPRTGQREWLRGLDCGECYVCTRLLDALSHYDEVTG